jgi:hypothetical protein
LRFKLSDDEYIDRLRSQQRTKRYAAICMIAVGLLLSVGLVQLILNQRARAMAVFDKLQDGLAPTTTQVNNAVETGRQSTEFMVGLSVGAWFAVGVFMVAGGLVVLTNGRRDRLLLEHYAANRRVR